jgi:DNA topoisomerase-3
LRLVLESAYHPPFVFPARPSRLFCPRVPQTAEPLPKTLIIAEKPSVANDIARSLGGFTKQGEYFESDDYVLSSAVGHLLELAVPEQYEVKRGKWSFANLPMIPPHFDLKPIERSADRLRVLLKLLKRKDVDRLVNACDAGREGELIFQYILRHSKTDKPVRRLWLQSMTPAAIRDGFTQLRDGASMRPLADAAVCRSEADWLVGINGTRAMTAFNSKEGGFYLTTVGRVQTPTLAILVEREQQIRRFIARDYWEVHASFAAEAGVYPGRWFDPAFRKDDKDAERKAERIWAQADADAIVEACHGKTGTATEESKPTTQMPPLLFDLTSLQREANARFGFSARTTLSIAQALYERHKALTYPRTDSRALPDDYVPVVKTTLRALLGEGDDEAGKRKTSRAKVRAASGDSPYGRFAHRILDEFGVKPNRRVFDGSKVSDHFAIIPTPQPPKALSEVEQKLYDMVVRRFLSVFYPAAEHLQTTRITEVAGHRFKSEGKVLVKAGWLEIYGREVIDESTLPAIRAGESVRTVQIDAKSLQTRPPARYSEATLLSAMEGAGKLVDDEELREAMSAKGLGTPATRAAVIEGLISEEYVHRVGRELHPTPKAFSLFFAIGHFGISELASPELTGQWEFKLKQMEQGKLGRSEFMDHITEATREMVERIRNGYIPETAFAVVDVPCPKCNGVVQENYRKFQCQNCDFSLWKVLSGREWAPEEIAELIRRREIGPLSGFRSRMGRPFTAVIRLDAEHKLQFDFGNGNGIDDGEPPNFEGQEPVGKCPKCAASVFELPMAYVCARAVGAGRTCDFRSGKVILQQAIERPQMVKLLTEGRTDLLTNFVSRKNSRKFKAFLVKQPDGKVGFEFAAREPKAGLAGKAPAADGTPAVSAQTPSRLTGTDEATGAKPVTKRRAAKAPVAKAAKAPAARKRKSA